MFLSTNKKNILRIDPKFHLDSNPFSFRSINFKKKKIYIEANNPTIFFLFLSSLDFDSRKKLLIKNV